CRSIRVRLPLSVTVHIAPAPSAPWTRLHPSTRTDATTRFVVGSMRNTGFLPKSVQWARPTAHTVPSPTAMSAGGASTRIAMTSLVGGSIRDTLWVNWLATHTAPSPIAMPSGPRPTSMVAVTAFVTGSMRDTVPSPEFVTHTDPSPTATPAGWSPTGIDPTTA